MGRAAADHYGKRPIDAPAYTPAVVAMHLGLAQATVRYWALGRGGRGAIHKPVIEIEDPVAGLLSFVNLVEVHILSSLTRRHKVHLRKVRSALMYLRDEFHSNHPLIDERMWTSGRSLFVKKYGTLINASEQGQLAMESMLARFLRRVQRDDLGLPVRLFPFARSDEEKDPGLIMIDPRIQFGRPCISGTGIPTEVVSGRFLAGEEPTQIAKDVDRPEAEILEAIRYEQRQKRAA